MALSLRGRFSLAVLCLDEPGLWAPSLRREGIPVFCLYRQPGVDLQLVARLASFARRNQVRLFHAHQSTPWFYAGLARLMGCRSKILFEEHGRLYPEVDKPLKKLFNRLVLQGLTQRIVAVSADVKWRLVKYEGISPRKIEVVYNGTAPVDPLAPDERFSLRRELGFHPQDFVIGTLGRIDPIKNLPLLLKAVKQSRAVAPRIKALIVGDGPELNGLKQTALKLGLDGSVVFTGYRGDTARLTSCMDLFVLPSLSEGTSMALLEAMALGVPQVVTKVGGNPEIVLKDQTGWVVPSGSLEDLTRAIMDAASNPAKRRKFAEAAKLRYQRHFTFEKMMESYRRIYLSLNGEL